MSNTRCWTLLNNLFLFAHINFSKYSKYMEADAKKDLIFLILFLVGLGFVWYYTGGLNRESSESPFVIPPYSIGGISSEDSGNEKTSGSGASPTNDTSVGTGGQLLSDLISFGSIYKAKETDPEKEYIEIKLSTKSVDKALLSGLRLKGVYNLDIPIGDGVRLYWPGVTNSKEPIFLDPGGKAIVTTGQSPVGYSFRVNKCTGYLEQFQDFNPRLSRDCPYPRDEYLPSGPGGLDDICLDYIERLPKCEIVKSIPAHLSSQCQEYVSTKINYKSCVDTHRDDADFYKNEWRIFLGRSDEMWKEKRETIELLDKSGSLIKSISY